MKKYLIILIIIGFIPIGTPVNAQIKNLGKKLKNAAKKEAKKAIEKEVKPLTLDYKITNVNYNPLKSLNKVSLDIDFFGNNPNKIGVTLHRIEFDLYIDGKHASKFYNEKKIKIPKEGDFAFEERAALKLSVMGKAIFDAIIKKKAKYRLDGTYFLDTKFGTIPIKVKLMEKVM
ncbi:MAG: LEA type 2 family protein [Candidatus Marinimicrobia bacterium]|jgi:hypothetical protein|nr:LEA type 2 family protein [Candidatus Neomarinimicrobiota bacterium]MDP6612065.1 LEA type 2 family protein [Candidatus Neomarinimicrobiota bacterium]|tara:strand:+ start:790 stop:1311 length:522 start_codon:yes stop_codon:yes gene_type:complete